MPTPLASQTIARVQQALRNRDAASLPEVIKLIEELSGRAFSISVQELADLISRDTTDPKLRPFLAPWLMGAGHVSSFILLPLQSESVAYALILGTHTARVSIQPLPRELQLLKAIRQHLTSARRLAAIR